MQRVQNVTPFMVVEALWPNVGPVVLFPHLPVSLGARTMRAWDKEKGWHHVAEIATGRKAYKKTTYDFPAGFENAIRVYTDTPTYKKARQGLQ